MVLISENHFLILWTSRDSTSDFLAKNSKMRNQALRSQVAILNVHWRIALASSSNPKFSSFFRKKTFRISRGTTESEPEMTVEIRPENGKYFLSKNLTKMQHPLKSRGVQRQPNYKICCVSSDQNFPSETADETSRV